MKQRHVRYAVIGMICLTTSVLFNNCAGNKTEEAGETSEASTTPVTATTFSGKLSANLQNVLSDGRATGYASDSVNKSSILKVLFYVNGPVGTGTYIGQAVANQNGIGTYAGHYFNFQLPPEYANGGSQKLYAYAHEAKPANLISPSPLTYVAYTPKTAGASIFNANITPYINNNCARCHQQAWTYRNMYYGPLINPTPAAGGTAANNKIIRKMTGQEGHAGGTFCSSPTDGFCANIQAWWRAEFQ